MAAVCVCRLVQAHRIFPLDDAPGFWNWLLGMRWSREARELGKGGMVIDLPLYLHTPKASWGQRLVQL